MSAPHVSILVVSYNTRDLTVACLRSIFAAPLGLPFEVIVVDNASDDGSADAVAQQFPQVRLIRSADNLGFAAANNLAASDAGGGWLLMLNPDTEIRDDAVNKLIAFAERAEAGGGKSEVIAGGRTLFPDGQLNPLSCHNRPTAWSLFCIATGLTRALGRWRLFAPEAIGGWRRDTVRQVDAISGCFLLIRRRLWNRLGGLDTAFFMYGEETDLCLRAGAVGARCLVCPEATIVHHGGASEPVRADKMVRLLRAKVQLISRHWPGGKRPVGFALLLMWPMSRMLAFRAARLARRPWADRLRPWHDVWQRRREFFDAGAA